MTAAAATRVMATVRAMVGRVGIGVVAAAGARGGAASDELKHRNSRFIVCVAGLVSMYVTLTVAVVGFVVVAAAAVGVRRHCTVHRRSPGRWWRDADG